jgi:hypothetical protein
MGYAYLADLIVAFHLAYVGFIVLGQVAILVGLVLKWDWIRNLWFRLGHLIAIGIVGLEAVWGIACPLTVWEDNLRSLAGQEITEGSFIGRWLHYVLFYRVESWILNTLHIGFALLVLVTFILAPPRWHKRTRILPTQSVPTLPV